MERLWEWETLFPNLTSLPQYAHFAMCRHLLLTTGRIDPSQMQRLYIIISQSEMQELFPCCKDFLDIKGGEREGRQYSPINGTVNTFHIDFYRGIRYNVREEANICASDFRIPVKKRKISSDADNGGIEFGCRQEKEST